MINFQFRQQKSFACFLAWSKRTGIKSRKRLTWLAVLFSAAALVTGQTVADESSCTKSYIEYRSCSESKPWCGFDTYMPTVPKMKYLCETITENVGSYSVGSGLGYSVGFGKQLSAPGTVKYSASADPAVGNNGWSAAVSPLELGRLRGFGQSSDSITAHLNYEAVCYILNDQFYGHSAGYGGIAYDPDPDGKVINTWSKDCVWSGSTNSPLIVFDGALNSLPSYLSPTCAVFTNMSNHLPAGRTYTLSTPYSLEDVEDAILADLANCPTDAWSRNPISAESTLSDDPVTDTVTIRKVGYRINFNSEPDANYLVTWDVVVSYDDGRSERHHGLAPI